MVGSTLNHYRLVKALGSGGMGDVYLADDTRLKRQIAVKILPEALAALPDRLERFQREAQAVAALNHANIVTLYSVEEADGTHFLTLEYVDGRTLADLKPKSGLPLRRLLTIAAQVVDAVIAAHDRGIVHRDLKPANVMVTAADRVKVLDFGLAKLREAADEAAIAGMQTREITGEGKIVGTVAYMSPEQAEGKPVDGRSDLFSIGVMLYELAIGEQPFKGDTSLSVLSSILRDTPKPLSELSPALPRDLDRIIRRCLAKDPERRYQSAKDLRNDLEELTQSLDSGELAAAPRAARHAHGRARWIAAAAGVAVAAAAAGVWWRTAGRLPQAPPPTTHTRLTLSAGVEQFPTLSPDGKWIVYTKAGDLFLQSVTGQTPINLTNDGAGNQMAAFSPDGESIAFRSARGGGGLFVMGRTGESVHRVAASGFHPAWFPDGRRLVFCAFGTATPESISSAASPLLVVGLDGGEPRPIVTGYFAAAPRVSPHGQRIAFWAVRLDLQTERYNRDIWTVDADGAHPVRATTHEANDWNPVWSPDGAWLYFHSNRGGSMNLWRVAIDEGSGRVSGEPQAITAPTSYAAHFTLSADGRTGAYASFIGGGNIARVGFDAKAGRVDGAVQPITTGTRDFAAYLDVTQDGARALSSTTGRQGHEDLYVVSVGDGRIRQLTDDFARDRGATWSRDGKRALFYSDRASEYAVWSVDVDGGGLRQLTHGPFRGYPVVSRDGMRLVTSDLNTHLLYVYDMADLTKPIETLPPIPDVRVVNPIPSDWSPDGRSFLYTSSGGNGVWLYSTVTRTHTRLADGGSSAWLEDGGRFVYSSRGRLHLYDIAAGTTREILAVPGSTVGAPRLANHDSQLFFVQSVIDSDIWIVRFGDQK